MHPRQKEVVWSPELAYLVGLITTDGCLSSDGRHIDFTTNDKELIGFFKKFLNLKNKIARKRSGYTKRWSAYHIQFGNVTLYKWLVKIGLMPNKSKQLKSLLIPDEYFFDFLRGSLDGDGSISKYFDPVYPNSLRLYLSFSSGSLPHLLWIQNTIKKSLKVQGFFSQGNGVHMLKYGKSNSIALLKRIYYDSAIPCLQRKFSIVKELVHAGVMELADMHGSGPCASNGLRVQIPPPAQYSK